MIIKVGFLAASDCALLEYALPPVYASADRITTCIVRDRLTWTGDQFVIEPAFFDWLKGMEHECSLGLTPIGDVVQAEEPAELAALVVRAHGDRALWVRFSSGGRARIAARFSPARVRADLVEGVHRSPALELAPARRATWLGQARLALGG